MGDLRVAKAVLARGSSLGAGAASRVLSCLTLLVAAVSALALMVGTVGLAGTIATELFIFASETVGARVFAKRENLRGGTARASRCTHHGPGGSRTRPEEPYHGPQGP